MGDDGAADGPAAHRSVGLAPVKDRAGGRPADMQRARLEAARARVLQRNAARRKAQEAAGPADDSSSAALEHLAYWIMRGRLLWHLVSEADARTRAAYAACKQTGVPDSVIRSRMTQAALPSLPCSQAPPPAADPSRRRAATTAAGSGGFFFYAESGLDLDGDGDVDGGLVDKLTGGDEGGSVLEVSATYSADRGNGGRHPSIEGSVMARFRRITAVAGVDRAGATGIDARARQRVRAERVCSARQAVGRGSAMAAPGRGRARISASAAPGFGSTAPSSRTSADPTLAWKSCDGGQPRPRVRIPPSPLTPCKRASSRRSRRQPTEGRRGPHGSGMAALEGFGDDRGTQPHRDNQRALLKLA